MKTLLLILPVFFFGFIPPVNDTCTLSVSIRSSTMQLCVNDTFFVYAYPVGGTQPYSFTWIGGNAEIADTAYHQNYSLGIPVTGNFWVICYAADANGCAFQVSLPDSLQVKDTCNIR